MKRTKKRKSGNFGRRKSLFSGATDPDEEIRQITKELKQDWHERGKLLKILNDSWGDETEEREYFGYDNNEEEEYDK